MRLGSLYQSMKLEVILPEIGPEPLVMKLEDGLQHNLYF
jgi:hypothetical protein